MSIIRPAAVAGKFYPRDPLQLENEVRQLLDAAETVQCQPKILIAPHAGYEYSGPTAASAFATLLPHHGTFQRVVILGTCHASNDSQIFTTTADSFETPLGPVNTDTASVQAAIAEGLALANDQVHQFDHAIEVQLPFLKLILDSFEIAPFLVQSAPADDVASLIRLLWGGDETLFVISSDLSHYHAYEHAAALDRKTAELIVDLNDESFDQTRACGHRAIASAIQVAREQSLRCVQLDLRNSGDTAGSKRRVVGYGAFAFF